MEFFTTRQKVLIADFFSNMAVVWFAAAFIAPISPRHSTISFANALLAIIIALSLVREVKTS